MPVVAGSARRGAARLSAVLRQGRGKTSSMYGVERSVTHASDHLPALGGVGEDLMIYKLIISTSMSCSTTREGCFWQWIA